MILLEVFGLKKYYGDRLIVDVPELKIYKGDAIGVVGENGAGKTTLLELLNGEMEPDEGMVRQLSPVSCIRQFSEETIQAEDSMLRRFLPGEIPLDGMSGGEMTRLKIANALSQGNRLLFADEPTSNLDSGGIRLLTEQLKKVETLVVISHDRALLDALCSRIWEVHGGTVTDYPGNYSAYVEQKQAKLQRVEFEYQQYRTEKHRLTQTMQGIKGRADSIRKAPKRMGNSEARLHRRAAGESQQKLHNSIRSIESRLERLDPKERPKETPRIRIDFSLTDPPENKVVLSCRGLGISFGKKELFQNAGFEVKNYTRTAIVGPNGAGKTTLLRLITDGHSAIRLAPKARLGYFSQTFENLDATKTVLENAMAHSVQSEETVRTVLARLLFRGDTVYKPAAVLSGGEKIKLSLAGLLVSKANVLLLDEPTNYLDLPSIEAMQTLLQEYPGILLFVSHDREFVNAVANRLLMLREKRILSFDGNLSDYEAHAAAPKPQPNAAAKMVLEMRLTRILSELSSPGANRDALEEEYQMVQTQLKEFRKAK